MVSYIGVASVAVGVGLVILRKYREWVWGWCTDSSSLKGKVFLITGANCGIGLATARQLLERQATVIMANRDMQRTQQALQKITPNNFITYQLDLASFQSIKSFTEELVRTHSRIDVIINNAGVSVPLQSTARTEQNFELNIGVNHFGHFLLTNLLLKKLISPPSRIVIVSSLLHEKGCITEEYIESEMSLEKLRATGANPRLSPGYCNSKLANVYHGRELAEKGLDVRLVCPGWCYTSLFRHSSIKWLHYILFAPIAFFFMRTAWQGSQTVVYCATKSQLPGKSGDFYRDCGHYVSKVKFDANIQKKLWAKSAQLTSSNYP